MGLFSVFEEKTETSGVEIKEILHVGKMSIDDIAAYMNTRIAIGERPKWLFAAMFNLIHDLDPEISRTTATEEWLYRVAVLDYNNKNYICAAQLFKAAAEYEYHEKSQEYLARMYNEGIGVEKINQEAAYWLDRWKNYRKKDYADQEKALEEKKLEYDFSTPGLSQ